MNIWNLSWWYIVVWMLMSAEQAEYFSLITSREHYRIVQIMSLSFFFREFVVSAHENSQFRNIREMIFWTLFFSSHWDPGQMYTDIFYVFNLHMYHKSDQVQTSCLKKNFQDSIRFDERKTDFFLKPFLTKKKYEIIFTKSWKKHIISKMKIKCLF